MSNKNRAMPTARAAATIGVEPLRVSSKASITIADSDATAMLPHLNEAQRAFILRMKPHRNSQRMNAADWKAVEPCVDVDDETGLWPTTYWFGGMRGTWKDGRAVRRFQFSEAGLLVRQMLLSVAGAA